MVALSVSISAITSPALTASPSFLSHLARLPFSIGGESAGMRMLIGMAGAAFALLAGRRHGAGVASGIEVGVEAFANPREQHVLVAAEFGRIDVRDLPRRGREQQSPCGRIVEPAA